MKIIYKKIKELIPYVNNPRNNNQTAIDKVASSIKNYGFKVPIVIDKKNEIVCGHTRYKASEKLGLKEVPCIIADDLTPAQIKAFRIADNKVSEFSEWDMDILKNEMLELKELDFEIENTGFDIDELDELFPTDYTEKDEIEDEVPEVNKKPFIKRGDVIKLGNHRIMCGDSTNISDLEKLTQGQLVDMWITDPPYNVDYEGRTKEKLTIKNDSMGDDRFRQFLRDAYTAADIVMKPGAVFYIWHADSEGYNFRGAAKDVGWTVRQCLIWKKSSLVLGRQDYHWQHEPCLYGWKDGAGHLWASDRKQTTILEFDRPARNEEHPTMKPVSLFEYQLLNNTKGDDLVLDSFGGSGTTLIAAEKNGRIARIMELDEHYCDVIIKRWLDYTGQQTVEVNGEEVYADFMEHLEGAE